VSFFVCRRVSLCLAERPAGKKGTFFVPPGMKPRMKFGGFLLSIGFVGAGKVGKALGLYFKQHGLELSGYCSRTATSAREAAGLTGSGVFFDMGQLARCSDLLFLTAPDLALEELDAAAAALVREKSVPPALCWVHVSGALSSGCLKQLKALGCPVGSMHPLQSFGSPAESAGRLNESVFSIEGTDAAVDAVCRILEQTGAKISRISAEQKPLYHAGACVLSNYLVTLLYCGTGFLEAAGLEQEYIFRAVSPLIEATLANIREKGAVDALTGPIVRGDFNTLSVHLQALKEHLPSQLEFYTMMAEKTIQMVADKRITEEQKNNLIRVLEENRQHGR